MRTIRTPPPPRVRKPWIRPALMELPRLTSLTLATMGVIPPEPPYNPGSTVIP
jgi:hypothetical protein